MRNKILITLILILSVRQVIGQTSQTVSLAFAPSEFTLTDNGTECNLSTSKYITVLDEDTLAPALPYVVVNVLMRPNCSDSSMTYTQTEDMFRQNIMMASNPKKITTDMPQENAVTHAVFGNQTYPSSDVRFIGENVQGGYKYASFLVSPFRYDAATQTLSINSHIDLTIVYKKTAKVLGNQHPVQDDMARKDILMQIVNRQDLAEFYPLSDVSAHKDMDYKYLIVTNDSLKPVFQKLADWKTTKGIRTKVMTVEDICRDYSEKTKPLKIKKAIYDFYKQYGIEYVLLGGDADVVPAQICAPADWNDRNDVNPKTTPSDLFYVCFDGSFDWDADGNGILAEYPQDQAVLNPLLCITRLSVDSKSDAETIVDRTLEYECHPDTVGWNNNILLAGGAIGGTVVNSRGEKVSSGQYHSELMYDKSIKPYWDGGRFRLYDTWTDHPQGAGYPFHPEQFQDELSKGYKFVDVLVHGWTEWWGWLEDGTVYNKKYAEVLKNRSYSLITTLSCCVNWFDASRDTICLSEALMRNPDSKVIAFAGNSRQGFYPSDEDIFGTFYEGLFKHKIYNYGKLFQYVRNAYIPLSYDKNYRWLLYTLNPLGDTEMPVYTECPQALNGIKVSYNQGQLTVKTPEDCKICISSENEKGLSYYAVRDSGNQSSFDNVPETFTVCVTKHNYIPYVQSYISGENMYVQNTNIGHDTDIKSNKTIIGSDVTSSKAKGPVTIHDAKVKIESIQGTYIKDCFSVKKGAELKISTKK